MQDHDQRIIHSSNESNYRTPPACFQALHREFDFEIDAAANQASKLCLLFFGPDHGDEHLSNALTVDWFQYALDADVAPRFFLNPPFSKTLVNAYNTGRIKVNGAWQEHPIDREMAKVYDVANWAEKCWQESQKGCTIVGIFPFAPQTDWYRRYVMGHGDDHTIAAWNGHCAMQERRLPHRISFLTPEGEKIGNAGVNSAIVVWQPNCGIVGPWQPHSFYWSYREAA